MRFLSLALMLCAAFTFGACGDQAPDSNDQEHADGDHDDGDHAAALAGAGWDGGAGFDPGAETKGGVRAVAFFKPG